MNVLYSWCLDHGRLHAYRAEEDAEVCTARRIYLDAVSREAVMNLKETCLPGVTFFSDLEPIVQCILIDDPEQRVMISAGGGLVPIDTPDGERGR
ncbi:hypothetical protein [Streptomyces sp. 5-10]|uniref:hypothetical protein n=1 Tax=Streptomyces sp. 5-10 TaxID=878925 RepID=UPI00168BB771|nr:hypothetical protein [Streptomyces sp. 5-10]MBD3004805.1 hypothetical protein [Streptomyces sp. 5-10]